MAAPSTDAAQSAPVTQVTLPDVLQFLREARKTQESFLHGLRKMKNLARQGVGWPAECPSIWYELDEHEQSVRRKIQLYRHQTIALGGELSDTEDDLRAVIETT